MIADQDKPLLSICIPTYNRANFLGQTLESIYEQEKEFDPGEVELVLSDNASTDGTRQLVSEFSQRSKLTVKYYANQENVGFDGNCLLVVERASGQNAWILGDDDLIAKGALKKILQTLRKASKADLYYFEKEDFLLSPERPIRFRRIIKAAGERFYDFRSSQVVEQYFRDNRKLIAYCNYLSNLVFKREKWQQVKNKQDFIGTAYIQVFVFQSILWGSGGGIMYYSPAPIVRRRWGNDATDVMTNAEARLRVDVQMYHRIAAAVFADLRYVWQMDDLVIRNDAFSWAVRAKIADPWRFLLVVLPFLFSAYRSHLLFWLKFAPLALLPGTLLRFMRGMYRKQVKGEPIGIKEMLDK